MTVLRAAGATDVGLVRSSNEDQLLVAEPLFAVADGMGGHAAGEVASLTAIEALLVAFDGNRSADGLLDAVRDANRAVWEQARERPELRGMGTTMTALALVEKDGDDVLVVVNVGDSRAYLLRDGELDQLTEDHSVPEELRRAGRLSAQEAASDPRRHVLTRVLGVDPEVEVDSFELIPYRGDRLLLASDGLFGDVADDRIAAVLRRRSDPEKAAKDLVALANEAGGADNITVVVVDVLDDDDRAAKASANVSNEVMAMPRPLPTVSGVGAGGDGDATTEQLPRALLTAEPPASAPAPRTGVEPGAPAPRSKLATLALVLVLVLLVGSAAAAVVVYARGSYFVGAQGEEVVIFKGRPGGLLWFRPTVEERTGVRLGDVLPSRAADLRQGKQVASMSEARRYLDNIEEEARAASPPPPATSAPPEAPPPAPAP